MTVQSPQTSEIFTVRTYKRLTSNPSLFWANNYEVQFFEVDAGLGAELMRRVANEIVQFEKTFHLPNVLFDRVVVSTYVEDGQPYNPNTFLTVPFTSVVGERTTDQSGPEALTTCLLVRRSVAVGRTGRALYRGVLQDSEVTAASGSPTLTAGGATTLGALVGTAYNTLEGELQTEGFVMVMRGGPRIGPGQTLRFVQGFQVAGITIKQLNNRYFDRP